MTRCRETFAVLIFPSRAPLRRQPGKVVVNALISNEQVKFGYQRPVKAVSLDPEYGRKGTRQLVAGGAQGQLSMIEKGWFGNKDVVLHAGEGTIHAIKWRGSLIAWANDTVRRPPPSAALVGPPTPCSRKGCRAQRIGSGLGLGRPQGVKIYDCISKQRISYIERDKTRMRADMYHCSLCWKSDTLLLIAWADMVHVARIKVRRAPSLRPA